ncbi:MAG: GNAT family N-acetyltransferase [Candidatus Limnocylindrales bacterium]
MVLAGRDRVEVVTSVLDARASRVGSDGAGRSIETVLPTRSLGVMTEPERIALRPWAAEDLALQHRLLGDPVMIEYVGGPETPEAIERRHERFLAMTDPAEGAMFAAVLVPAGTAVGSVGYWPRDEGDGQTWEAGWFILPEFQRRGFATAATRLAVEAAWVAKARPVHAYPSVANAASNATARKAGFRLLGSERFEYPKGQWMTCNDWVIEPPGWVSPAPPD